MKRIIVLILAITGSASASIAEFVIKNELESRAQYEAQEYQRLMVEILECAEREKNLQTNIEIVKASNVPHKEFILGRARRAQAALNHKCRSEHLLVPRTEAELFVQTFAQELVKTLQN